MAFLSDTLMNTLDRINPFTVFGNFMSCSLVLITCVYLWIAKSCFTFNHINTGDFEMPFFASKFPLTTTSAICRIAGRRKRGCRESQLVILARRRSLRSHLRKQRLSCGFGFFRGCFSLTENFFDERDCFSLREIRVRLGAIRIEEQFAYKMGFLFPEVFEPPLQIITSNLGVLIVYNIGEVLFRMIGKGSTGLHG